jgi:hypothetical protein
MIWLRQKSLWSLSWALCLALALGACSPQAATPSVTGQASSGNLTSVPAVGLTGQPPVSTATGSASAPKADTLPNAPAATQAPPPAPASPAPTPPAAAAPCANDARFIRDVTIPDGMQLLPGQLIDKKWSVKNAGTCDWSTNYRLALISGDALGAPSAVALYPARAGEAATWEIQMVTPQNPGAYTSKWQARDPAGHLFGAVVFIKIEVIPLPTASSP